MTEDMGKVVQEFHVVTVESFLQLIIFAYQILHKEIINVRRCDCNMQHIVHD